MHVCRNEYVHYMCLSDRHELSCVSISVYKQHDLYDYMIDK